MTTFWVILISLLCGIGRFFIPGHDLSLPGTYEAFAHIWVGFLLAYCIDPVLRDFYPDRWKKSLWALLAITVLEGIMFALR